MRYQVEFIGRRVLPPLAGRHFAASGLGPYEVVLDAIDAEEAVARATKQFVEVSLVSICPLPPPTPGSGLWLTVVSDKELLNAARTILPCGEELANALAKELAFRLRAYVPLTGGESA